MSSTLTLAGYLLGSLLSVAALFLGLLLLLRTILIVRSQSPDRFYPSGNFYAPRILAQFDTCLHRYFEEDDGYSRALFIRYGDLLRRDLNQIRAVGEFRARAWCWVFRIWHGILSTGPGWKAFGRRTEGLRVLATALISATGSRPTIAS